MSILLLSLCQRAFVYKIKSLLNYKWNVKFIKLVFAPQTNSFLKNAFVSLLISDLIQVNYKLSSAGLFYVNDFVI